MPNAAVLNTHILYSIDIYYIQPVFTLFPFDDQCVFFSTEYSEIICIYICSDVSSMGFTLRKMLYGCSPMVLAWTLHIPLCK